MGKKIKKAVKSVTSIVKKASVIGKLTGDDDKKAKDVAEPVAAPSAVAVEAPKENADEGGNGETEAARKAARARGKRGLSVARASGTGLNI